MPTQVFSFYIFDRHTECIYSRKWLAPAPRPLSTHPSTGRPASDLSAIGTTTTTTTTVSHPQHSQAPSQDQHPVAGSDPNSRRPTHRSQQDDDAKLIFGTVFSLRNMARKLGGDDDAFIGYHTAHYKLHYYETPSSLRFAMLTEPGAPSMRNVLHQIYINLWVEYVVKNPLAPVEHRNGEGVRNEMFEMGLDKFIRGLM